MIITIRSESAKNPEMMQLLQYTTSNMIRALYNHGIHLPDNTVKIWIKEYSNGSLFPKVEFDWHDQELQYDLTTEGEIKEAHFKSFVHTQSCTKRKDVDKKDADPLLIQIDDILRGGSK